MPKQNKKYCYLEPDFPDKAFMVLLFLEDYLTKEAKMLFPLDSLYQSLAEASESIANLADDFKPGKDKKGNDLIVGSTALVLPISFSSFFPLKKKYWRDLGASKNTKVLSRSRTEIDDRFHAFIKATENPRLYILLVTPAYFEDEENKWYFSSSYPFNISVSDQEIEKFMCLSSQSVDERAKNAAIYSFGSLMKFDWISGEVSEIPHSKQPSIILS